MAQILVDTFTGTNGVTVQSRTSNDGKSWTKAASSTGDLVIQNNRAVCSGVGLACNYFANSGAANADQVGITDFSVNNTSGFFALWARCDATLQNGYYVQLNAGQARLGKKVANINTNIITSSAGTIVAGSAYRITISCIGSAIKGEVFRLSDSTYLNSGGAYQSAQAYFASVTDTGVTVANLGVLLAMFSATDTTSYADNFSVTDSATGLPRGSLKEFFPLNPSVFTPPAAALAEVSTTIGALGYIGGNIQAFDYMNCPWVDIVNNSRGFGVIGAFSEGGITVDASGWPTQASRNVICVNDQVSGAPAGVYKGRFEWQSTVGTMTVNSATNCSVSNIVTAGLVTTFDVTVTGNPTLILDWTQGIKDLRIITAGYPESGYPLLRTEALAHYKQFACLRAMDYMRINNSAESTWSTRVVAGKTFGAKSWESLFAFATACYQASGSSMRSLWICVPHLSDSTYWTNLATLALASLPSDMVVYWEYSNECGNTLFTQELYLRNTAVAEVALGGSSLAGGDQFNQRSKLYGRKSAQMAQAVLAVYPSGSLNTRVRPVITSLFVDATAHPVDALAQMAGFHGAPAGYLHTVASAPYPQGSTAAMGAAVDAVALLLILRTTGANSLATEPTNLAAFMNLAASYGLHRCVAYEWGPHTHDTANQAVKYAAHIDPDMGNLVQEIARKAWAYGWGLLNYYHVSPSLFKSNNENTLWPASQDFGSPDHKLVSLLALKSEIKPTNG